jgi:hypothetical protein
MLAVRSSEDRRPSVVFNLRPGEKGAETLTRMGGCGGSPGSFPRRWRWVGATQHGAAISAMVWTAGQDAGKDLARPRRGRPNQMLNEVYAPVLLD